MPPSDQNPSPKNSAASSPMQEVVTRLKESNNVLITVSANPSIDQLAACIGMTLALNKKDKHATAVFSGAVPSTLEFLEPEKTLEKNTDSLRDFIISLDKSKADKLRYKVEDNVVKIFITPYKTSISDADLDFSQGDFNVDVVLAIGVHAKTELDDAIVAHGRILHDATVVSINIGGESELGSIHWSENDASSLSEMVTDLIKAMDVKVLDEQIATSLLTGIVAETDRFRNEKSTPHTMSTSGLLMSAGASTQLVSSKLEEPVEVAPPESEEPEVHEDAEALPEPVQDEQAPADKPADDGSFHISHDDDILIDDSGNLAKIADMLKEEEEAAEKATAEQAIADIPLPEPAPEVPAPTAPAPETNQEPYNPAAEAPAQPVSGPSLIYEPPSFGGQLTANTDKVDQQYISAPDPLTSSEPMGTDRPILNHVRQLEVPEPLAPPTPTLKDIEQSLNSPHAAEYHQTEDTTGLPDMQPSGAEVQPVGEDYARDAVQRAVQATSDYRPEPLQSIGSMPLGDSLNPQPPANDTTSDSSQFTPPPPVPPPLPPMGQ